MTHSAEYNNALPGPGEYTGVVQPISPSPGMVSVFGLASVLRSEANLSTPHIDSALLVNMPPLETQVADKLEPIVPLAEDAQERIKERARSIVVAPYTHEATFSVAELAKFETWFNGSVTGMSDAAIARSMDISRRTLIRIGTNIREYLDVPNQASAVYSILLHGHELGRRAPDVQTPRMTINRFLHLYLAALGFEEREAVELTNVNPNVSLSQVKGARRTAVYQLGGRALSEGILAAYRVGLFRPLDQASTTE